MLHLFLDQRKVFLRKLHVVAFLIIIGVNGNQTASHVFQLLVDRASHSVTNRDNHNDGSDTDDNTQHGEGGAPFIRLNIHQGDFYVFPYLSHFVPYLFLVVRRMPFSGIFPRKA